MPLAYFLQNQFNPKDSYRILNVKSNQNKITTCKNLLNSHEKYLQYILSYHHRFDVMTPGPATNNARANCQTHTVDSAHSETTERPTRRTKRKSSVSRSVGR